MIGKRKLIALGGVVVAAAVVAFLRLHVVLAEDALSSHLRAGGSWIGKNDSGLIFTVTFAPADPENNEVAFVAEGLNLDSQLGGVFPEASNLADGTFRGEAHRVGPRTFEYVWTAYGKNESREIVTIAVGRGTLRFRDEDSYDDSLTVDIFSAKEQESAFGLLPDQDVDDDGLPDSGQEPILSLPVVGLVKRLPAALDM